MQPRFIAVLLSLLLFSARGTLARQHGTVEDVLGGPLIESNVEGGSCGSR